MARGNVLQDAPSGKRLALFFRGDLAPAMGWVARGRRILEGGRYDCVEEAWLLMLTALPVMFEGDAEAAYPGFAEGGEIGERFSDPDATTFPRLGQGVSLILQQRTAEGMALLDEVMVAVTTGEVSPIIAGITYCQVVEMCQRVFDLRRAREWTEALSQWCDSQPELVPFRGNCLVHRCEIFQLQGAWRNALDEAQRACEWLSGPPAWDSLGSAYYQLGEIQRLQGEFASAEVSYRRASLAGREPEPGMSLLHLARGRIGVALAGTRRFLEQEQDPIRRSKVLPAYVEIALEAKDIGAARAAADELAQIAADLGAPYLHALATHAMGAVLLAEGQPRAGLMELRSVLSSWRDLNAPYQAARVRVLMGEACRELGDDSGAALEFEAARAGFEELGASVELEHVALLVEMRSRVPGGLSAREKEVLVLVAPGKTVMLVPDQGQALREMVRVTKPGGRVLLIAYGPPADLEFLQFSIGALRAVAPDFPGLPDDPPPLEFQVSDPKVLSRRLTDAGLKDVTVERTAERPAFRSGEEMWDWVMNGNPIPGMLIADLNDDQQTTLRKILDGMLRERYGENGLAVLTKVVNIGIGTK